MNLREGNVFTGFCLSTGVGGYPWSRAFPGGYPWSRAFWGYPPPRHEQEGCTYSPPLLLTPGSDQHMCTVSKRVVRILQKYILIVKNEISDRGPQHGDLGSYFFPDKENTGNFVVTQGKFGETVKIF